MKPLFVSPLLLATLLAGTSLNCVDFATSPGSLFETVRPLSEIALMSDDNAESREFAQRKLASVLEAARQDSANFEKQVAAGFLAEALRQIWGRSAAKLDGMAFLHRALEIQPKNPELHLLLALAYLPRDSAKAARHRILARDLAQKNSAAAKNLEKTSKFFPAAE